MTSTRRAWGAGSLVVLAAFLVVFSAGLAYGEDLTVGVGEQRLLSVPPGSDITFTGPLHIARVDRGRVKVIGDSPGWGSVTIKSGEQIFQYSVTIVAVPPEQTIAKMKALMGGLPLTYSAAAGQVVVEGRIETTADLQRFNTIMEAFPGVVNMVVVTAKEPLIDIAVTLVEVDATNGSGFGILDIALPTGNAAMTGTMPLTDITAGKVNPDNIQVSFGLSSTLLEALNAQIESGRAKIIANPRIVTQNRKEAMITSGGQIPYRAIGANGAQGVEYKPYGITLRVTPEERASDVLLQLSLESSEPVGTVSGLSENPLTSRGVELSLAVQKDQTLAIAGLYNAVSTSSTRSGCFFPLFSTSAASRKREIIVLVTPRVTLDGIRQDYYKMVDPKDMTR